MSGHSKWSTIKRKKGAADAKRGKVFSKVIKEITVAARAGGGDPEGNPRLRAAIALAKSENMPKDNIDRAIKKISDKSATQLTEIVVEAIGPGGVAMRLTGVTDNSNRTISEIKKILAEHHAKMVQPGSIGWIFQTPATLGETDQVQLDALLEDLDNQDDINDVVTNVLS